MHRGDIEGFNFRPYYSAAAMVVLLSLLFFSVLQLSEQATNKKLDRHPFMNIGRLLIVSLQRELSFTISSID